MWSFHLVSFLGGRENKRNVFATLFPPFSRNFSRNSRNIHARYEQFADKKKSAKVLKISRFCARICLSG